MGDPEIREIRIVGHYIPVSHEQLVDSGTHQCDQHCPPPWVPPVLTRRERVMVRLRSVAWRIRRLPGYRLVHRDDICDHDGEY